MMNNAILALNDLKHALENVLPAGISCKNSATAIELMRDRDRLACADCGATVRQNEWYMVRDDVWEQAWAGRRQVLCDHNSVREILCIGCLEQRIGRTLMASDFTAAPVNDPNHPLSGHKSERMRHRLRATASMPLRPTRAAAHRDNCPVLQGSARRR
jgi:hypothetical protein